MKMLASAVDWFTDHIYPVPVAPFVQMLADEIINHPGHFTVSISPCLTRAHVGYSVPAAIGVDMVLCSSGFAAEIDTVDASLTISTYYFDNVCLNRRERRVMVKALCHLFEAFQNEQFMEDQFLKLEAA